MDKKRTTVIPTDEYERLLDRSNKLECLMCCGVDNWSGYPEAMHMYRHPEEYEDEESE